MGNGAKAAIGVVVVVILVAVGYFIFNGKDSDDKNTNPTSPTTSQRSNPQSSPNPQSSQSQVSETAPPTTPQQKTTTTVTYNGSSFEPATVSINAGDSVKIVNQSDTGIDFESDPHPQHTDNTELNAGDIDGGQSKTITIAKKGNWGYHNHLNPTQKGTITVK